MATLKALQTQHGELSTNTRLAIYGVGALVGYSLLFLRRYYREKAHRAIQNNNDIGNNNNNNNNHNHNGPRIIIPLSRHKTFWGSYLLSGASLALFFSTRVSAFCEKYIPRVFSHRFSKAFQELLPPIPKSLSQAFKLGQLEKDLTRLEGGSANSAEINQILQKASELVGASINSQQLHDILNRIISMETKETALQKVRGLFKFVNVIWGLSIFGISITVIPVVYFIGKPVWDELYNFFKRFAAKTGRILYKLLVNDTAFAVYEVMGYLACWYFMYLGLEGDGNSTIGFFTSLTGVALAYPMMAVSAALHGGHRMSEKEAMPMIALFTSLLSLPIAYKFKSPRVGFVCLSGLYGYSAAVLYGMGGKHLFDIIFDGDLAGLPVMVSGAFNLALIALKLKNMDNAGWYSKYKMFIDAQCTLGCIGIYSALLGYSWEYGSWWYYPYRRTVSFDYLHRQATMVLSLLTGIGVGSTLSLPAMRNTAYVYSAFYAMQKTIEYRPFWTGKNAFFTIFLSSILAWRTALYLHKNPQIFVGMFKFE